MMQHGMCVQFGPGQVYVVYFHMMHFGKCCPKPSLMLSNLRTISMLKMGPLTRDQKDSIERVETCRSLAPHDICTQLQLYVVVYIYDLYLQGTCAFRQTTVIHACMWQVTSKDPPVIGIFPPRTMNCTLPPCEVNTETETAISGTKGLVHLKVHSLGLKTPARTSGASTAQYSFSSCHTQVSQDGSAQKERERERETARVHTHTLTYIRIPLNLALAAPRSYTRAFGKRLLEAYEAGRSEPRMDLRTRPKLDLRKSDRELFEDLPMGDIWFESQCHLAVEHLFTSKSLRTGVQNVHKFQIETFYS